MEEQYKIIRLEIGDWWESWSDVQEVDFKGRLLVSSRMEMENIAHTYQSGTEYEIYETAKNRIVFWRKDWNNQQRETITARMEVFDSIDELEGNAPHWLIRDAKRALGLDVVEHLDI